MRRFVVERHNRAENEEVEALGWSIDGAGALLFYGSPDTKARTPVVAFNDWLSVRDVTPVDESPT